MTSRSWNAKKDLAKVRFFRVTELIALLMEAKEEKQLLRFRKQIKQPDLVVRDELGYAPTGKAGAELLFDVLSTACERQSLIVTTNLPFEQWTEVLGSERITGAALDRLTHFAWSIRRPPNFFFQR